MPPACFGRLQETYQETTGDKLNTFLGEKTTSKKAKKHAQVLDRESSLSCMRKFYSEPEGPHVCFFRCHQREAASRVPGHVEAEAFGCICVSPEDVGILINAGDTCATG